MTTVQSPSNARPLIAAGSATVAAETFTDHNRNSQIKWLLLAIFMFAVPATSALAATFDCREHTTGPYCVYIGPVDKLYVNAGELILLYWDESITTTHVRNEAESVGIDTQSVLWYQAGGALLTRDPNFGNLLYATLLTAKAGGLDIHVQLRPHVGGYLEIDRVWIDG